jgi:hypothetical protein
MKLSINNDGHLGEGSKTPLTLVDEIVRLLSLRSKGIEDEMELKLTSSEKKVALQLAVYAPSLFSPILDQQDRIHLDRGCHFTISILKFVRSTLEILYDFDSKVIGFPWASQFSLLAHAAHWPKADVEKNIKYFTACPMALYLHNPTPPLPSSYYNDKYKAEIEENRKLPNGAIFLFSGAVKKFLVNRLRSFRPNNDFLWNSFLQGIKRGCHEVSEQFINNAYKEHANILSQPPKSSGPSQEEILPYLEELFSSIPDLKISSTSWLEPSSSASLHSRRSDGGGYADISASLCPEAYFFPEDISTMYIPPIPFLPSEDTLDDVEEESLDENFIRDLSDSLLLSKQTMKPENGVELIRIDWNPRDGIKELHGVVVDLGLREIKYQSLYRSTSRQVEVHGIPEPLKCRMITKADAFQTFACHPLQRHLWKYLSNLDPFLLLRQPVTSGLLRDQLRFQPGEFLVSGDYKAATDGLNINTTKLVLEFILTRLDLPIWYQNLCRAVLYEQKLVYPPKTNIGFKMQQNGQLMGSILSFPILCIINLLGYWLAQDAAVGSHTNLQDLRVLINGDDILFPSDQSLYDHWLEKINLLGFTLSVGKNYTHSKLCTVNSQCFRYMNEEFVPIHFFNTGLLTGQSKHTGRDSVKCLPTRDYYNEVVQTAHNPLRAHNRFLHYFKDEISKITQQGNFNLFAHTDMGGLGFTPPSLLSIRFTHFQKKWASFIRGAMDRRIAKFQNPFRLCIVQKNPTKKLHVKKREYYCWVPLVHSPENQSVLLPLLCNGAGFQGEKATSVVRAPPGKLFSSFRRFLSKGLEEASELVFPLLKLAKLDFATYFCSIHSSTHNSPRCSILSPSRGFEQSNLEELW